MKHIYLTLCSALLLSVEVSAQTSATDNPANLHSSTVTSSAPAVLRGGSVCGAPSTSSVPAICDSGSVTLTATGAAQYSWFTTAVGGTPVATGSSFTTPVISTSTDYYVAAICLDSTSIPLPPQTSTYNGNIRGYFFTAPVSINIIGVRVPEDADTGPQTIEIVRFNAGAPPAYPGLTSDFVSLAYFNGVASSAMISTNITVNAGDVIGVYGWRNKNNSYTSGGSYTTAIGGFPVTLERSGMQYDLDVSQMFDVWSEAGGAISRTEVYYSVASDTSVHIINAVQVNHSANVAASADICSGDSVMLGGDFQTTGGVYMDTLSTVSGCDSIITTTLTVNSLPSVTIGSFPSAIVCVNNAPIALPAGTPAGGTYSGPGISGSDFDPSIAGAGVHTITYSYEDANLCSSTASTTIEVDLCTGIVNHATAEMTIYPNPASDLLIISGSLYGAVLQLTELSGKVIISEKMLSDNYQINLKEQGLALGMYLLKLVNNDQVIAVKKVVLQ